jgi:hypothetical protein
MESGAKFVKEQKVISPGGEGFVVEVTDDQVTVKLQSGETKTYPDTELEDDSDAG